ncbi:MAG: hypothetical protein AB4058_01510 [Microcystaceae cyanobacterium]
MKIKDFPFLTFLIVLAIIILVHFSAFTTGVQAQTEGTEQAYQEALKDAQKIEDDELLESLTVIIDRQSNPNLLWDEQGRVLVATFTNRSYQSGDLIQSQNKLIEVWVTVVPELKTFCTNYVETNTNPTLNERLDQLLGLIPDSGKTDLVEILVDPQYLKRPTRNPNPALYDQDELLSLIRESSFPQEVTYNYRNWYNKLENGRPNSRYPWTGLGYTYDWGIYPKTTLQTDAGLSEFVIFLPPNTDIKPAIEVHQVFSPEDYCR